jgi:hypothetical protein
MENIGGARLAQTFVDNRNELFGVKMCGSWLDRTARAL